MSEPGDQNCNGERTCVYHRNAWPGTILFVSILYFKMLLRFRHGKIVKKVEYTDTCNDKPQHVVLVSSLCHSVPIANASAFELSPPEIRA